MATLQNVSINKSKDIQYNGEILIYYYEIRKKYSNNKIQKVKMHKVIKK